MRRIYRQEQDCRDSDGRRQRQITNWRTHLGNEGKKEEGNVGNRENAKTSRKCKKENGKGKETESKLVRADDWHFVEAEPCRRYNQKIDNIDTGNSAAHRCNKTGAPDCQRRILWDFPKRETREAKGFIDGSRKLEYIQLQYSHSSLLLRYLLTSVHT